MKLALAMAQTGVHSSGWVTDVAGALAVGEIRGARETPVAPLSRDPRLALALSSDWAAGRLVGPKG